MPGASHARGRGVLRRARRARLSRAPLAEALRAVLLDPDEALAMEVHGGKAAAVLAPLYVDAAGDLHAIFTKRRHDLRRHPGEISFPGGRQDAGEELIETALRETHEEIGLPGDHVEVLGALTPTATFVTNYAIYPFVGLIEPGFEWKVEAREVALVLELRLRDVRAGHGLRRLVRRGVPFRMDTYQVGDHLIWGATARIVAELLERVKALL